MSESGQPDPANPAGEPVGNVGEEAAKLLGALSDWARDQGADVGSGLGQGLAGLAGHAAGALGDLGAEINEHVATGAPECTYCPVCRTVHVVRQASPEVRAHLTTAATALLQAGLQVMTSLQASSAAAAAEAPRVRRGARPDDGIERIDLDDDEGDRDDEAPA